MSSSFIINQRVPGLMEDLQLGFTQALSGKKSDCPGPITLHLDLESGSFTHMPDENSCRQEGLILTFFLTKSEENEAGLRGPD
jgi:hypothetical protein